MTSKHQRFQQARKDALSRVKCQKRRVLKVPTTKNAVAAMRQVQYPGVFIKKYIKDRHWAKTMDYYVKRHGTGVTKLTPSELYSHIGGLPWAIKYLKFIVRALEAVGASAQIYRTRLKIFNDRYTAVLKEDCDRRRKQFIAIRMIKPSMPTDIAQVIGYF